MAWAERKDSGRWAGRYLDHRGRKRNAGTFPTKEQAVSAAARREGQGESGEVLDLTIEEYFTSWAYSDSNHGTSRETRMGHLRTLRNHVFPKYGNRRMAALQDSQLCRQILYGLQDDPAVAKSIPGRARNAIGAGVRPLVNRQILSVSPVHGIRLSSYVSPMPSIPTKEEFGRIVDAMETEEAKFLTRFALWTAMRPGELFALRIHDIVWDSDQATILQRRKTVRGAREGDPVVVEREGSKTGGQRRVTISPTQSAQLREYLARTGLSGSDLLFPKRLIDPTHQERRFDPEISAWDPSADYGSFEAQGRTARHGSTTGYGLGCRCRHCKNAETLYRRKFRAAKRETVGKRPIVQGSHAPAADDYMRVERWNILWHRAIKKAATNWSGKVYAIRACSATWMLEGSRSITEVQQIMGHRNKSTTLVYERLADGQLRQTTAALDGI